MQEVFIDRPPISLYKVTMGLLYNPLPCQQTIFGGTPSFLSSILGPPLGRDTSGNFALSAEGLAVRIGNRFVIGLIGDESERLVDVTSLVISGIDPYVYRLPVSSPRRGDLILISDCPFSVRYILGTIVGPTGPRIFGLDPADGDVSELIPAQNPFISFFVKVVSLFSMPPGLGFGLGGDGGEDEFKKRPAEAGEAEKEDEEMGERSDFGLLLLSLLLNQQQCAPPCPATTPVSSTTPCPTTTPTAPVTSTTPCPTTTPNLLTLLLLMSVIGGGRKGLGLLELVLLMSALQQPSAMTGYQTGLPGDGVALALLLFGLGRRDDDDFGFFRRFRGEGPKEEGRGFRPGWRDMPAGGGTAPRPEGEGQK